jgi:hypothetical protein
MAYGLEIYKASGTVSYTSTDVTWSFVGFLVVAASTSTTQTFPAAAGMTLITQQWLPNTIPNNQEAYTHTVVVSGNTVTVSNNGTVTTNILVLAQ